MSVVWHVRRMVRARHILLLRMLCECFVFVHAFLLMLDAMCIIQVMMVHLIMLVAVLMLVLLFVLVLVTVVFVDVMHRACTTDAARRSDRRACRPTQPLDDAWMS